MRGEAPQARKSGLACYGALLRGAFEGSPRRARFRYRVLLNI